MSAKFKTEDSSRLLGMKGGSLVRLEYLEVFHFVSLVLRCFIGTYWTEMR